MINSWNILTYHFHITDFEALLLFSIAVIQHSRYSAFPSCLFCSFCICLMVVSLPVEYIFSLKLINLCRHQTGEILSVFCKCRYLIYKSVYKQTSQELLFLLCSQKRFKLAPNKTWTFSFDLLPTARLQRCQAHLVGCEFSDLDDLHSELHEQRFQSHTLLLPVLLAHRLLQLRHISLKPDSNVSVWWKITCMYFALLQMLKHTHGNKKTACCWPDVLAPAIQHLKHSRVEPSWTSVGSGRATHKQENTSIGPKHFYTLSERLASHFPGLM